MWFFYQQIGEPPQQFRLRTTPLEAARPEPHLVRKQLRHPALPDAVEHEKRVAVIAAHNRHTVMNMRLDLAEPTAPRRFAALRATSRQLFGYRMPAAEIGELRFEPLLLYR